ncbi:hypothetical protein Dsin_008214 [Dipteronia sinensis]|uniref:RRM domain-containing protein n=1 Tax=Dipteronia sinensis TaxID=43782 RepID=A0AAE0APF2_9ROSI|nr:hypothetical protein Dsin_008214 [Dipteronia sinensis]
MCVRLFSIVFQFSQPEYQSIAAIVVRGVALLLRRRLVVRQFQPVSSSALKSPFFILVRLQLKPVWFRIVKTEERMEKIEEEEEVQTRIYVGGLGEKVTSDELKNIFSSLGTVKSVEIVRTKSRSFAYLDFCPSNHNSLSKLFSKYNGCVWKGARLRLEKAKEHYLARMNREWSEDAQVASSTESTPPIHQHSISSSDNPTKPNKVLQSENKMMLNIFFPRLSKLKSLPFTGTGKHKYSFQRIQVPPLPKYFCACEEHLVPFDTAEGKQIHDKEIHDLESHGGVIDDEELNIMNSVMRKLLEKENASNAADNGTGLANDGHKLIDDLQSAENEADEDNLITNVSSRGNNGTVLSRYRQNTTISPKSQKLTSGETQTSKDRPTQNVLKVQKMNITPLTKKRKLPLDEECIENESVSTKPVGDNDMNMQTRPNKSRKHLQAQPAKTWSQKMSWKTLVGDKDNSIFSVSNILPAFTPTKEVDNTLESIEDMQFDENEVDGDDLIVNVVSKKNKRMTLSGSQEQETVSTANQSSTFNETQTSIDGHVQSVPKVQKKNNAPNKKRKSLLNGESDRKDSVFASSEVDGSLQTDTNELVSLTGAQPAEPESHVKQSITDHSGSQKRPSLISVGDKGNDAFSVSNMLPCISANEGQPTSDGPDVPDSTDTQKRSLVRNEDLEGKSAEKKIVEVPAEAQPTNNDAASNKSGTGSSWFQKSPWTQLVTENNSSFSITQISASINFEKHEVTKPYMGKDTENMNDSKFNNLVKQDKERTRFGSSMALEGEKEGDVSKNFSKKNKQTVSDDSGTSAVIMENKSDSMQRQTSNVDVSIGETCSFMRSATSIKEWAKTKAAISGSGKKKSTEK